MLRGALHRWSDRPALCIDEQTRTYGELFADAESLAGELQRRARPGEGIGILAQRSYAAFVGVLAAVIADRPYVPINMKFPFERQRIMASAARCATLISDRKSRQRHEELDETLGLAGPPITDGCPDHLGREVQVERLSDDSSVAYVMFTSGTTGVPKGVAVRRENLAAYLAAIDSIAPLEPGARCSQLFDLSFDLSVHDLFRTWVGGGCLFAMKDEETLDPIGFAKRHALHSWFSVPSVVGMAKRLRRLSPGILPDLRLSLFCGEALSTTTADEWAQAAPNSKIFNLYGPTETTIAITAQERAPGSLTGKSATVPLGRAFSNSAAIIMGDTDSPAPLGEVGEIWLSGAQVSSGYINNEEESKRRFVDRNVEGVPYLRWYRTGDLASADSTGCLHFRGRLDDQIKIQGYRVELLEVEEALRRGAAVAEVAAVAWPISEEGSAEGLVGFVCSSARSEREIIAECRRQLPTYMAPKRIVFVESLPLNANGKVDRASLRLRHLVSNSAAVSPVG